MRRLYSGSIVLALLASVAYAAIDDRDKRATAASQGPGLVEILPVADGAIDAGDRAQLIGVYAVDGTPPPVEGTRDRICVGISLSCRS